MGEWLRGLFTCRGCAVWQRRLEQLSEAHARTCAAKQHHTLALEREIEDLKEQRDKAQDALMRVLRVTPTQTEKVKEAHPNSPREQFHGSPRNWNDVKAELERQHRKPRPALPEDVAKMDAWQRVNEAATQQIPELRDALEKNQVVSDKSDVEFLAEN